MSSGLPLSYPVYFSSCTIGILVCIFRCHGHCLRYCWDSFLRHHYLVVVIVVAVKVTVVDVVVIVVVLVAVVVVKVVWVVSIVAKNRSCQDNRDRVCHTLAQFPDLQKCRFFNSKARTVSVNHKARFMSPFVGLSGQIWPKIIRQWKLNFGQRLIQQYILSTNHITTNKGSLNNPNDLTIKV